MLFKTYGQAVLTLHERHSRLLIAVRPPGKAAEPIAKAMIEILAPLPPAWRQTVTFDNGTEFACHYELHDLNVQTFFCDTYARGRREDRERHRSDASQPAEEN